MKQGKNHNHKESVLKIGGIAAEVGILPSHIRYYTRLGLLYEAGRTRGGYRLYRKTETIKVLKKILELKKSGLSLDEIKNSLDKEGKAPAGKTGPEFNFPDPKNIFKNYPIKFAYLFGSYATGKSKNSSDVDIAVYFDDYLSGGELLKIHLSLVGDLCRLFHTDKVDITILNKAPLPLKYRIVYEGRVLYCAGEKARSYFETTTMSLYFDRKYYYDRHLESSIAAIAEGGIL